MHKQSGGTPLGKNRFRKPGDPIVRLAKSRLPQVRKVGELRAAVRKK